MNATSTSCATSWSKASEGYPCRRSPWSSLGHGGAWADRPSRSRRSERPGRVACGRCNECDCRICATLNLHRPVPPGALMAAHINRSRLLGATGSVAAHLIFIAILAWSLRTPDPQPEPKALRVVLVPWLSLKSAQPERAVQALTEILPAAVPTEGSPGTTPAATRSTAAPAPVPAMEEHADGAAVRAVLRAALGCSHERLLQLTAAERARCADQLVEEAGSNVSWGPPIRADKLAMYNAEVEARRLARRPDLLGCVLPFDASGFKPVSGPGYGTKLGPLPCYTGDGRALKSDDIRKGEPRSDWPP